MRGLGESATKDNQLDVSLWLQVICVIKTFVAGKQYRTRARTEQTVRTIQDWSK